MKKGFVLPIERCPACGAQGTCEFRGMIHDIPHFGETMETVVSCNRCKFRHTDVMHLGEREPVEYQFNITSEDDMMVRVVRSSTGTVDVPELGVKVRPGPGGEGYISNVEGVLNRMEDALKLSLKDAKGEAKSQAVAKLEKLGKIKKGESQAMLIIADPYGHSAIVDSRAKKRKLGKEEISRL
ncbi:MAG: ZPR1 zinc finger domain-containing protein [Candidatus Hadarchaeota archaeon]